MADDTFAGIVNPSGLLWIGGAAIYAAAVPATSYLTQEGGLVQSAVKTLIGLTVPSSSSITSDRTIAALAAIYTFATFAATGAASVAGQAMASKDGIDRQHPRAHIDKLHGFPLRLRSAHYHLMEMFPGFALAAALTQALAPNNQHLVNLLGLHVLAKLGVHYPSYLLNVTPTRSLAHLVATASVVNVCWLLATGAQ